MIKTAAGMSYSNFTNYTITNKVVSFHSSPLQDLHRQHNSNTSVGQVVRYGMLKGRHGCLGSHILLGSEWLTRN
jgi:hypothetical protein